MTCEGIPSKSFQDYLDDFLKTHTPLLPPGTLVMLDRLSGYATLDPKCLLSVPGSLAKAEADQRLWEIQLGH